MLYLASDGAGFPLKTHIAELLQKKGVPFTDLGTDSGGPCDYAPFGRKLAQTVAASGGRGILVCGTGVGISMAANRVKGARCVCCSEPATARLAREHNDANILAVGARIVGTELAADIVTAFLETAFSGEERHMRRIADIENAFPDGEGCRNEEIHSGATSVDERYLVTPEETKKILETCFSSLEPLVLAHFPVKEKKKLVILRLISGQFEAGKRYAEKEVNEILKFVYEDYVTIRRYLIEYGFMDRTRDCAEYWLKP